MSIRISARSKPATIDAFDMDTPIQVVCCCSLGGSIINREQTVLFAVTRKQTHEIQRPKICARVGSATRLNAGSHPTGGRDLTATAGDETLEVRFSVSGSRSPLFVRLTETACCAVLAAPGVLTAPGSAPTIRPTAIATAITLLRARGGEALLLDVEKLLSFLSISAPRCGGC